MLYKNYMKFESSLFRNRERRYFTCFYYFSYFLCILNYFKLHNFEEIIRGSNIYEMLTVISLQTSYIFYEKI